MGSREGVDLDLVARLKDLSVSRIHGRTVGRNAVLPAVAQNVCSIKTFRYIRRYVHLVIPPHELL